MILKGAGIEYLRVTIQSEEEKMINIGIIGAGHIGEVHANAIGKISGAQVVAVHDVVDEKARAFSNKYKCKYYNNMEKMISQDSIDVISICVPTFLHAEIAEMATQEKKNIFCEKPLAMSIEEADRMIEAVKENNVTAMIGHILRFWPAYIKMRDIIRSGVLGKPLHGYFERLMTAPPWVEGAWNKKEEYSGGAALDIQVHDADYVLWLFGEPKRLKSEGVYSVDWGGWMHMATAVQFEGDKSALLQVGWGYPVDFPFTNTIRITCEMGAAEWSSRIGMDSWKESKSNAITLYKFSKKRSEEEVGDEDPFVLEWQYFINCLSAGQKIENSSFEDGKKSLELVLASVKSAREESVVYL
jgi:predicted dehydrogenase